MGVKYLTTFVKDKLNFYKEIEIIPEIQRYYKENGDAIIIFDFMGFIHSFNEGKIEAQLGGRASVHLKQFKQFLDKLQKAGASLVFFCDGQLHSNKVDEWCRRRNREFTDSFNIMENDIKPRTTCKAIVKSCLKLIEDNNYGKIIISTDVDCDAAIAQYANEHNAFAIFASDSDYLIFEGAFQFWYTTKLDWKRMRVGQFNRSKLREELQLNFEQMKIFATIAGNDFTNNIRGKSHQTFIQDAKFCRSLKCETDAELHKAIAKYIKINRKIYGSDLEAIENSIKSYQIDFELPNQTDQIIKHCISNVLMYAFYTNQNFQYDVNFLDFKQRIISSDRLFIDILLKVFRKLGGILLFNKENRSDASLKIVTKYNLNEEYMLKKHTPIYPDGNWHLDGILCGPDTFYEDTRWELLLWSIGLNEQFRYHLENIPKTHFIIVLALTFLYKAGEISERQADALLVMNHDLINDNIDLELTVDSRNLNKDTVRTAHLYNRAVTLIWDCLTVCGLTKYIVLESFDGIYYDNLLRKFEKSKNYYDGCMENIHSYRLYATKYWK